MTSIFEFVKMTPPQDILGFASLLQKRLPKAAQLCNVLEISVNGNFNEEYTFYRYNGLDDELTCFVSQLSTRNKTYWNILSPICPEEQVAEVIGLFSKLVNWDTKNSFNGVDSIIFQYLSDCCPKRLGFHPHPPGGGVYFMPKELATKLDADIPEGVSIRKLSEDDMDTVFSHWVYAHENPDVELIVDAALQLGSAGLIVNGELVSWGIAMRDGGIHAVHTLEAYRGNGYGKIVMKHVCRSIAEEVNLFPVVHVEGYNSASVGLMTGVGFQFSHSMTWTDYDPLT